MVYVLNSLLGRLVGCRLYSVQFVMDYVQLWFDSETSGDMPSLTCDVLPQVVLDGRRFAPAEPGWAEALRTLIGQNVSATHEKTSIGLKVDFARGAIQLHSTANELEGLEIATLSGFDDRGWMVWRPGEEAFEDL
ncbi:hypothetical protein A6A08_26145 [Nocardiopsis sp. TSRI0078]|uniref:hypothetical protein n=1 Tax=unclassified Nocardiopsis TaxID=2649073 RepID=UPI00095FA94F|nr:hypothetical protein [Nocardiopsis sp. TSRI0078]OKI16308.1 hypothetical protein A6A08_26145 [Nocardiopsis sp. TSRI0078]